MGGPATSAPHRVGRLSFELDSRDEAALLQLRAAIVGGAETWIPQALGSAFDALDEPGRTVHILRLEVDLGRLPPTGLTPELLAQRVQAVLSRQLRTLSREGPAPRVLEETASLAGTLRHFLEHGRLPWWSAFESVTELERSILNVDVEVLRKLVHGSAAILAQPRAARRLVLQFIPQVGVRLAAALPGARPGAFKPEDWPKPADKQALEALVGRIRRAAAQSPPLRAVSDGGDAKDDQAKQKAEAAAAEALADDTAAQQAETLVEESLDSAIAVSDAGLVLLHPFLPALFEARRLAAAGCFTGEAEQQRAIRLTAYLAGGETAAAEPQLVMAKLLCGWSLDEPVPRESDLTEADRAEAEQLLRVVIGHWSALGRASPAALRETFLARPGRLWQDEDAWRLEVERRGTDVLLERLPWALGALRLPWMARPVFVDWA